MKGVVHVLYLGVLGYLLAGCLNSSGETLPEQGKPDLVITAFTQRGPAFVDHEKRAVVPVHLVVRNQGDADAKVFKISTSYKGPRGTQAVAFTVPRQEHPWYPYTWDALEAGADLVLEGIVTFDPALHHTTVLLFAIADSCSGEKSMPAYCRIEESNEDNNQSAPITVTVP